jgi:hypothetical protein
MHEIYNTPTKTTTSMSSQERDSHYANEMVIRPQRPSDIGMPVSPCKSETVHRWLNTVLQREGRLAMLEGGEDANGDLDIPGGSAADAHQ